MKCSIIGLGTALPPETVTQEEAFRLSSDVICQDERQVRKMRMLFRKAGVETRQTVVPWQTGYEWSRQNVDSGRGPSTGDRMLTYATFAPPLATTACETALADAGVDANSITHLVTVSCTGFAAPGIDFHMIRNLGLPPEVQRVNVAYMGCHGAINGLRTARGLLAADPQATVLLCAVELCSLHYRMNWDEESIIGNALFADGAAAVVLRHADHATGKAMLLDTHSCWMPETGDQMSWDIGDYGFEMKLSGEIPDSIGRHLRPAMEQWLAKSGLSIEAIGDWIIHPGGPRILDAVQQTLGLSDDDLALSRETLRTCGNMSSPTVLFILQQALQRQRQGPRLMLAFGPGLVAEGALLN